MQKKHAELSHCISLFFFAETFQSFFDETFKSLKHSIICLTVVLKVAIAVFICLYFQTF